MRRGNYTIGYCTNVHAGATLAEARANLETHALEVKRRVSPSEPMGVGLWLSAASARELVERDCVAEFRDWLESVGLLAYTLNGFPYDDFHQQVVKHRVYKPTWADPARLTYTKQLVDILHELLPVGAEGSISTLPLEWGRPAPAADVLQQSAMQLRQLAAHMAELESETGRLIHVCIEPEPGCVFDRGEHIVNFYEKHLLPGGDEAQLRRHIRVCHDVCHSVVMFEGQTEVLELYRNAGIEVGKIQVSSAVVAPFEAFEGEQRDVLFDQLATFNEPRYLHQTVVRRDGAETFYEDLPQAIAAERSALSGEWRTHFHVPIYLREFGALSASQPQIEECLAQFGRLTKCRHLEAETYAWSVLPKSMQPASLAAGIADEMLWLDKELSRHNPEST